VSCRGVIGPYFFEDEGGSAVSVTSHRYVNMLPAQDSDEENIAHIPENTLRRAMQNLQNRLTECVQRNGQHLTDVIFKK
jgi:hypothetical protein